MQKVDRQFFISSLLSRYSLLPTKCFYFSIYSCIFLSLFFYNGSSPGTSYSYHLSYTTKYDPMPPHYRNDLYSFPHYPYIRVEKLTLAFFNFPYKRTAQLDRIIFNIWNDSHVLLNNGGNFQTFSAAIKAAAVPPLFYFFTIETLGCFPKRVDRFAEVARRMKIVTAVYTVQIYHVIWRFLKYES